MRETAGAMLSLDQQKMSLSVAWSNSRFSFRNASTAKVFSSPRYREFWAISSSTVSRASMVISDSPRRITSKVLLASDSFAPGSRL